MEAPSGLWRSQPLRLKERTLFAKLMNRLRGKTSSHAARPIPSRPAPAPRAAPPPEAVDATAEHLIEAASAPVPEVAPDSEAALESEPAPGEAAPIRTSVDPREELAAAVARCEAQLDASTWDTEDARIILGLAQKGPDPDLRQIPTAANSILAATQDLEAPRSKLAGLVERDPAIAQALLRTANSVAFNAGGARIASINHALDRLGMSSTRAVVLQHALNGLISRPGGDLDIMAGMVWSHMTDAAVVARVLAPCFAVDPDEAFATTLLHDVGKLVVFDGCSRVRHALRRAVNTPPDLLDGLLDELHEPLGAVAAEAWGMPPAMVQAIATHHRRDVDVETGPLTQVVYLAERVDIARKRRREMELEGWWAAGRLEGSPEKAATALERIPKPEG